MRYLYYLTYYTFSSFYAGFKSAFFLKAIYFYTQYMAISLFGFASYIQLFTAGN